MSTFRLEIVTPERKLLEEDVNMIVVKTIAGELGILPQHISLVAPLVVAPVKIKIDNQADCFVAVHSGFVEVHHNKVIILAEAAERDVDIDISRANLAKERAERRLAQPKPGLYITRAEIALQRAIIRLEVAEKEKN